MYPASFQWMESWISSTSWLIIVCIDVKKTLPFQLWVTRMQLMLNLCFFFPTLRFLATYGCYTLMSSYQQQLDHGPPPSFAQNFAL
jgi:hypothetical protein